jgi:hypothetical protein
MELFKCRASASGKLMTNPRNKSELLSETTKNYIHEWLKESIYGIRKEISTKQITKGIELEDMAIDKAIEWLDLPFAIKNSKRFSDDHFTGEPDLLLSDTVIDIKNSWDCWTFPLFENEIPTKDYYYQLQVYMHLTGLKKAKLVYVLLNTPETYNSLEISYDKVDKKYRIKQYDVDYDESVIDELKKRVDNAREYIQTIFKN